uniref:Uncharacterized protein n=1 Tax=Cyclopterus lumpus TaxID=8103 RepID=A0A8C2ZC70_CYCLU
MEHMALVSAKWLANMLGPSLHDLTSRGASFFDIDECSDRNAKFDHTLPTEQFFADYVGNLGVGSDSHVVGLVDVPVVWAFTGVGEGYPVSSASARPEAARFTATMNRSWVKSFEDISDNIATKRFSGGGREAPRPVSWGKRLNQEKARLVCIWSRV